MKTGFPSSFTGMKSSTITFNNFCVLEFNTQRLFRKIPWPTLHISKTWTRKLQCNFSHQKIVLQEQLSRNKKYWYFGWDFILNKVIFIKQTLNNPFFSDNPAIAQHNQQSPSAPTYIIQQSTIFIKQEINKYLIGSVVWFLYLFTLIYVWFRCSTFYHFWVFPNVFSTPPTLDHIFYSLPVEKSIVTDGVFIRGKLKSIWVKSRWSLEGVSVPWYLFDGATEWGFLIRLNLDYVKCKEKFSGTSFTYWKLPGVCLLEEEDFIQNSHV